MPISFGPVISQAVRATIRLLSPKIEELKRENESLKERLDKLEADVLILRELAYKTKQQ